MKLDTNYLNALNYTEMFLKNIEIEITPVSETDDADEDTRNCGSWY